MATSKLSVTSKQFGDGRNNRECVPIRALYVASIQLIAGHQIQEYFSQFGEVEFIQWNSINRSHYGFIQFKKAETAQVALSTSHHSIDNAIMKVSAADTWHQPDFEPDLEQDAVILNVLDDNCLQKIFRYLNKKCLCSVADVCIQFNQHAKQAFATKFKDDKIFTNFHELDEGVLRHFGPFIKSLVVRDERLLNMVSYCSPTKLKELVIGGGPIIDKNTVDNLQSIFAHLETLEIRNFYFKGDFQIDCAQLKDLRIISDNPSILIDASVLVDIKRFIIPNIKKLMIIIEDLLVLGGVHTLSWEPLRWITEHCSNLLELDLQVCTTCTNDFDKYIHELGNLKSLKRLKLLFNGLMVTPLMKTLAEKNVPIEVLEIINGKITGVESISAMKGIKNLGITQIHGFTQEHLIQLAKELPELQTLRLGRDPLCYHHSLYKYSSDCQITMNATIMQKVLSHAPKLSHFNLIDIPYETAFPKSTPYEKFSSHDYETLFNIIKNREPQKGLSIKIVKTRDDTYFSKKMLLENGEEFSICRTNLWEIENENGLY